MADSKKVDLTAAKEAENAKKPKRRGTDAGTGGSNEAYNVDTDKAERIAAKNEAGAEVADTANTEDEERGFIERVSEMDMKRLILFRVLPLILAVTLSFVLGLSLGGGNKQPEAAPQTVDNIEGSYSVLEDVESLKDDQIKALRKQIAALNDGESKVTQEELAAVSQLNTDTANTLNPFFDAVIAIDPQASESELATHQRNLAGYMTDSASTSTLYNLLAGTSPARELGQRVAKAGGAIPTWVSTSGKNRRTYLVVVPVVTEEGVVKAQYVVSMAESKIDGIDYLGVLNDGNNPIETVLDEQQKAPVGGVSAGRSSAANDAPADNAQGDGAASAKDADGDCAAGDRAEATTDENGQVNVNLC